MIGAGGVGLTAVATLKALGHKRICVVDVSPRNLDIATELGASDVVQPGDKASKQIIEACGGPVEAVIDFVNNDTTARAAFDALRKGGQLVQVGLFGGEFVVPTALMALKMLTISGSFVGTLDELNAVANWPSKARCLPSPSSRNPSTPRRSTLRWTSWYTEVFRGASFCRGRRAPRDGGPIPPRRAGIRDHRPGAVIRSSASIFRVRILR